MVGAFVHDGAVVRQGQVIVPDAGIEIPARRLRLFVEYESGHHPIGDEERAALTR